MKEMWNWMHIMITALGGWVGLFLGGWDAPLYALVMFVSIDYITGVMCGIIEKRLSSEIGFKGIMRKVAIFLLVGIGAVIDQYLIKTGDVLRTAIIFYYASNEGVSILENATRLGLPVSPKLKGVLEQLKDDKGGAQ